MAYRVFTEEIVDGLVKEFESMPMFELDALSKHGSNAGVYAIHLLEPEKPYESLGDLGSILPVYVGRAHASGVTDRLSQHVASLSAVGLDPRAFRCRFLAMGSNADASAAEALLIDMYEPVWNCLLRGFGNKNQGTTRHSQVRSKWDTMHPGRGWASFQQPRRDADNLGKEVSDYLTKRRSELISAA